LIGMNAPLAGPRALSPIVARLAAIRERVAQAARRAGRDPGSVTLVAVSKTHDAARIEEAIEAGQRVFGENRVQEAQGKFPELLVRHPGLELALIGPLQTNKAAAAVGMFDRIESLDRPKLAVALAAERDRQGRCPALLVQVNTGREPQKAGVLPESLDELVAEARDRLGLPVVGLMCIPPVDVDPRPQFDTLAAMAGRLGLPELSMGMSGDFEVAIEAGATRVRVGSAIFGSR